MTQSIEVLVLGAEHSGTRYVCGLFELHPSVSKVYHTSFPAGGKLNGIDYTLNNIGNKIDFDTVKIVWVCRDRSCNLASIESYSSFANNKERIINEITTMGLYNGHVIDSLNAVIEDFIIKTGFNLNNLAIVSYESLMTIKKMTLVQTFNILGLDIENYEYDMNKDVDIDWFKTNTKAVDGNCKYVNPINSDRG